MNNVQRDQSYTYGLIELCPDGTIHYINEKAKKLILKENCEDRSLFQCIKDKNLKTKLHECFMGKANEFHVTINEKSYFFLFQRFFKKEKLNHIHIYILDTEHILNSSYISHLNQDSNQSISEMAAGIAHEIRNPLTSVKGFLQLMEQNYKEEYAKIAHSELERAIHILNDFMSVTKPSHHQEKKTEFNISSELRAILLLFQNHFYKINLVQNFSSEHAIIFGKKDQIKKALFNIIKNAIEAMPNGGTLIVEQKEDDDYVYLSISDTGVGIPKEKLRLLGTPYFTMKEDGKGMGLVQVFETVKKNAGTIRIESEENKGTTIFLTFPKHSKSAQEPIGGNTMAKIDDLTLSLSNFLIENIDFYTEEWLHYLKENKSYITTFLDEHRHLEFFEKNGNPLIRTVAQNIVDMKTEEIMDLAKEQGVNNAKIEFPIHMAWELFQSSRGIIWNAVKSCYMEQNKEFTAEEFFTLERTINNIIDLYIDSYTAYYVNYKEGLLKSHRETLEELSVPIIPLADKICILPIIGYVDTYRAKKIREKTLYRVKELKAEKLIIDISGVPFVDTSVVSHLFKIVKGIKLLGCSTILTGISPEIADTMIELGIEVDKEVVTLSDLQQALQEIGIQFRKKDD